MRYLVVLIISMMMFTSAQAKPKSYLKLVVENCKTRYKLNKKDFSTCVLDYSNKKIALSELKKIFILIEKNKKLQWTLRFSDSRINNDWAQIISYFLRKGSHINILDILSNDMNDEAIKKIIAAAHANKHVKIVSLEDSTLSKLDEVYLANNELIYPRISSGDLKIYLGRRFLQN